MSSFQVDNLRAGARMAAWSGVLALILLPKFAATQASNGAARGTITDARGAPITGAKVVALDFYSGSARRVLTDARGSFAFDALRPGNHKFRISAASYLTRVFGNVEIEANQTKRIDAALQAVQPGTDGDTILAQGARQQKDLKDIPRSKVIQSISITTSPMTPFESNGDLWFTTWADDDNLYGTWGDGRGPTGELSNPLRTDCGIVKYTGTPPNLTPRVLLRDAPTMTNPQADNKPSSLLFFGKRLYGAFHTPLGDAWIGFLAYSDDYGLHWKREGFYYPGEAKPENASPWTRDQNSPFRNMLLINMGKAYSLNQDGFVYALAIGREYNWSGDVYLARVKKQNILKYAAWEYFTGAADGKPHWSKVQKDAVPVPNLYTRDQGSAIYHPGVKRYLFLTASQLFEAPEPWGPWSLVGDFPAEKPEWQRGYQPGIIAKGLGSNSFWFTIASQNRPPYLSYSFHVGQMVMQTTPAKTGD